MTQYKQCNTSQNYSGFLRINQILSLVPVGKSTWWRWCANGRAPKPIKLGAKTTVWKAEEISAFIAQLCVGG